MRSCAVLALSLALVGAAAPGALASPVVGAAAPAAAPPPSAAPGAMLTALRGAPAAPTIDRALARPRRGARAGVLPRVGIQVDAGVPDGANASIVLRPWRPLRLHAGGGHNGISRGLRAGFTLVPRDAWFSPSMSVDIGRYAEGDANDLARRVTGDPSYQNAMLERVGYTYTNAHLGVEMGRERATFYIHAGYSWMSGRLRDTGVEEVGTVVTFGEDPDVSVWTVSARVGLVVYL